MDQSSIQRWSGGFVQRCALGLVGVSLACQSEQFVPYGGKPPPTQTFTFISTDGQVFPDSDDVERITLRTSGAHDLGCPVGQVTVQTFPDQRGKTQWVVDGCGRRAFYFWNVRTPAPNTQEHYAVLSSLVPLSPAVGP